MNNKESKYLNLISQISALISGEKDLIANMANITAAIKAEFNFFWIGFYRVEQGELILSPFQGLPACIRIGFGKGVCGTAWKEKRIIIVEDVDKFPGHIACNVKSKSEIVIPIYKNNEIIAVLDIDEDKYSAFDEIDGKYLNQICFLL
jgi:GAF domain-containing protein